MSKVLIARVLRKITWMWRVFLARRLLVACYEIWRMATAPVLLKTQGLGRHRIVPPPGYLPRNPSILRTPEGWLPAVRAANYKIIRYGNHVGPSVLNRRSGFSQGTLPWYPHRVTALPDICLSARPRRRLALVALLVLFLSTPATRLGAYADQPAPPVGVQGRNVDFHLLNNIVLSVDQINGFMVAVPGHTISLDDRRSFTFTIQGAVARLSSANLTALLNDYFLPRANSPIKHVAISFAGQTMHIEGTVKKLLPVDFTATVALSPTPRGDLRVRVIEFRAAGIVTKGVLDFLGIRLEKLAEPRRSSSFSIEGDDLIVPMHSLFPPPLVNARLTVARIEGDTLYQELGQPKPLAMPPQSARNYLYFHGGRLQFGKLTMENVDLELIDKHQEDRFDFSLDRYLEQIGAGYARISPDLGIIAYAEDYRSLRPKR
jgi:hypothetical protein